MAIKINFDSERDGKAFFKGFMVACGLWILLGLGLMLYSNVAEAAEPADTQASASALARDVMGMPAENVRLIEGPLPNLIVVKMTMPGLRKDEVCYWMLERDAFEQLKKAGQFPAGYFIHEFSCVKG